MRRPGRRRPTPVVVLSALLALACARTSKPTPQGASEPPRSRAAERESEGPGEGERKKSWSGLSLADQTIVQSTPSLSAVTSGFDQERVWGGGDDWEPAVAADPQAPFVYQLTTRFGGSQPQLVFRRSTDGGATWGTDQVLANNAADPMIEVADDGTVYAMGIVGGGFKLQMTRSADHGVSWTPLANILGPGQPNWGDRPVLVVSPDGQDVYVGFNQSDSHVVSSHDGGASFGTPVQTSDDGRYWFHSAGAIAPSGDIYFAAVDYSQDYSGESHIDVLRSTDDGVSWATTRIDTSTEMPECGWSDGCYLGFLGPSVGLAIDVNGLVMIAYNAGDLAGESQPMWVRTSSDGTSWSERQRMSVPAAGVDAGFPAVAASRTTPGDFRVVWQDNREASQVGWSTWLRTTPDGGANWYPEELLSDLASGAPYKGPLGYSFVYGDYLEIAVDGDDQNHVIWGEGTSYTGPGGSWYTRGVPEPSLGLQLAAGIGFLGLVSRLLPRGS